MDSTTAAASAIWKYIMGTPAGVVSPPMAKTPDWQPPATRGAPMDKLWSVVMPGKVGHELRMAHVDTRQKADVAASQSQSVSSTALR